MEREQSAANRSEPEEIPHISTLSLAQLEASLAQQEAYSREALGNAFAGRQEAERHREAAIQCDADAQASGVRYEEAEHVIHELRKALVEKNKHMLGGHAEPGNVRASSKRQHSPSPGSNVARKRVALTDRDRRSETVIKEEDQTTRSHHSHAPSPSQLVVNNRSTTKLSDEDTDDDDDTSDEDSSDYEPHDIPETRKAALKPQRAGKAMTSPPQPTMNKLSTTNQSDEDSDDDDDTSDEDSSEKQRAAFKPRSVAKAMIHPSGAAPHKVFTHSAEQHKSRMVRRDNPKKEILIYTSGQGFNEIKNKKQNSPAHAGCAVIFESVGRGGNKSVRFPLEQHGPLGIRHNLNQRNAELRAFVIALELRDWSAEGWEKVTIATSSRCVHRGITRAIASWETQGRLQGKYQGGKKL